MKPASNIVDLNSPAVATSRGATRAARDARPSRWVDFYELTKPRMNFLVVITTMVGFLLAGKNGATDWRLLFHAVLGTALCAAAAAVINQLIERDHDALMPRTRNRPIPGGRIAPIEAAVLGGAFGVAGVSYLYLLVNPLTALLGFTTIALYLLVYTPAKRFTTLNTVIGAVPGAIPPIMGFTAAQNAVSPAAIALFSILFFWQMPHFLAIAILYRDDYRAGGFKMLPSVEENPKLPITGRMMILYSIALIPVSLFPVMFGVAGPAYFTAAVLLGLAFLSFAISCATSGGLRSDARKLFFASIIYLPLLLTAMMLDKI
ncbi:heme o synthase [soil metagenome]